jgi:hypothetical protein
MPVVQKAGSLRCRVVQAWTDAAGESKMILRLFELKITSSLQTSVSLTGSGASYFPERTIFIVLLEALAVTLALLLSSVLLLGLS